MLYIRVRDRWLGCLIVNRVAVLLFKKRFMGFVKPLSTSREEGAPTRFLAIHTPTVGHIWPPKYVRICLIGRHTGGITVHGR